jgi:DNA segregation ATPase FtsK/SpoIIIE, S-DNA-T family
MSRTAAPSLAPGARREFTRGPGRASKSGQGAGKGTQSKLSSLGEKCAHMVWQSRWAMLAFFSAFMLLALATYHHQDPGWSHATQTFAIHNALGRVGAYLADLALYLSGRSAYLIGLPVVVLAWRAVIALQKKLGAPVLPELAPANLGWWRLTGAIMLMLACMGLEASRLGTDSGSMSHQLPFLPGGVLGSMLVAGLTYSLGEIGSTLVLLLFLAGGIRAFGGVPWIRVFELTGAAIDWLAGAVMRLWATRQDRRVGAAATAERKEVVEERKREWAVDPEPLHINVVAPVEPSRRAIQERVQEVLPFRDLPADSELPSLSLLAPAPQHHETVSTETLEYTSRLIEKKLGDFGVQANVVAACPGPVITMYEVEPAVGVKGSQVVNLSKDLARALSLTSIRVVETIPGKNLMGLELPNAKRQTVRLSEILGSQVYADNASMLTLALGKDIAGKAVVADLAKMPHLLVAGTTGSGKSVGINAMLLSLLYKANPKQVRLILIDPKMLEMSVYEGIPHLLAPVVTDMRQAGNALNWCVGEMERRYRLLSKLGVRNLSGYNKKILDAQAIGETIPNPFSIVPDNPEPLGELPQIVVVIDELADLMMVVGKKIEELIARLAQKARAAGIHLILATQRPSVDVITGLIKANIPTRIAFQVSSKIDSRTILDQMGAEALLGQGDMLYMPSGSGLPQRVHGAFVADEEVHRVVNQWKKNAEPQYVEGLLEGGVSAEDIDPGSAVGFGGLSTTLAEAGVDGEADVLYDQAVEIVLKTRRASISLVQRHLRIGYNRAARLLEQMEKSGIVSSLSSNGNRDILVPKRGDDAP